MILQQTIGNNELILKIGDITKQKTDAIVNAANGSLMGGGGVDGAIHRKAGSELLEACKRVRENELLGAELETGKTVITEGYDLSAPFVIHTVGPVWNGEQEKMVELLSDCYKNALMNALQNELTSISFPSISTGAFHFPIELAAKTALDTVLYFLQQYDFGKVVFTLFSDSDYQVYTETLKKMDS